MTETTTSKPLGVALRTLYPGSYFSYQGVIFRVISPSSVGGESFSGVTEDLRKTENAAEVLDDYPQLAEKVFKIIRKEVERDIGITLPLKDRRPIRVKVPGKVDLRLDDTLEKVYCMNSKCGTMYKISNFTLKSKGLNSCVRCGGKMQQAPIFIPVLHKTDDLTIGATGVHIGSIKPLDDRIMFCHYGTSSGKCTAPTSTDGRCVTNYLDKLGSLQVMDPQRPIDSIKRTNPDCPKNIHVPPKDIDRPKRTGSIWYKLDFPRESMTSPLTASSVVCYEDQEDPEIQEVNDVLNFMLGQFFNSKLVDFDLTDFTHMKILETVYGYRLGTRMNGFTTSYIGTSTKTVLGRIINTKGFRITLKHEIYEKIKEIKNAKNLKDSEEEILEVILHSLKHALLVQAPIFTGLEENKFHGTFEINDQNDEWAASVYVYDAEDGGSGGFSTIIRNRNIFEKMLDDIRLRRLYCPVRECRQACKHCLYMGNCGFVNRRLNRKILLESGIFQIN